MSRIFTLTGPDDEVVQGLRLARSEGPLNWRSLDDEVFSVAEFAQSGHDLLRALVVGAAGILKRSPPELSFGRPVASGPSDCLPLGAPVVELLSRLDDTKLRALCESAWAKLEKSVELDPDWTQSVRTLVIQARSAVANGWRVFVVGLTS
ncbi:MAG: hypothetical protein AAF196_13170 [Planctomycetota bacterium]